VEEAEFLLEEQYATVEGEVSVRQARKLFKLLEATVHVGAE
jgi:hypothetical protein